MSILEHFVSFSALISLLSFATYIAAAILILQRLFHPKGICLSKVLTLTSVAMLSHFFVLYHEVVLPDQVNFSLPNVISLVCLLISLSLSILAYTFKVNLLLPVTYGFSGVWLLVVTLLPPVAHVSLNIADIATTAHVIVAIISYCILIIATLYAFQVSYINIKLKHKQLVVVNHLPPLMQVEGQLFFILTLGTVALVVSQLIGFAFIEDFLSRANGHKIILSLSALFIYIVTLWGHYQKGWRGHRVQVLMSSATVLLTLAYFGSRFVKEFLIN